MKKSYSEAVTTARRLAAHGEQPPADMTAVVCIAPDWDGKVAAAYGVGNLDQDVVAVLIGPDGAIVARAAASRLPRSCCEGGSRTMKAAILNGALPGDDFVDAVGGALQARPAAGWAVTPCGPCTTEGSALPGLLRVLDRDARPLPHRRHRAGMCTT